jgi:hypothetical protein
MAKTDGRVNVVAAEHTIEGFAEDLGKMLGVARSKAEGWLGQRQAIVKSLSELRDTATKLLSELGHEGVRAVAAGRRLGLRSARTAKRGRGRPVGAGRKKKRTMSAEARAAISRAQKARWAAQKAAEKRKSRDVP